MATAIHLLPWHIKPAVKLLRPVIVDGPIVATGDRFLVTEAALELAQHRIRLRCEQLSFDPAVVVGLIIDEGWNVDLDTAARLVITEGWNVVLSDPDGQFHEELWNMVLSSADTEVINELWES